MELIIGENLLNMGVNNGQVCVNSFFAGELLSNGGVNGPKSGVRVTEKRTRTVNKVQFNKTETSVFKFSYVIIW